MLKIRQNRLSSCSLSNDLNHLYHQFYKIMAKKKDKTIFPEEISEYFQDFFTKPS